jgi:HlyD family secretion protein
MATGTVDEVDVNRVKIDQPVAIASDAFPGKTIKGKIVGISAEATTGRGGASAAVFEVRSSFAVDDDALRKAIRIGMSARMAIETYKSHSALVVPTAAIINSSTGHQVRVKRDGKAIMIPVLLGMTLPEGVEVISGLLPKDVIFM